MGAPQARFQQAVYHEVVKQQVDQSETKTVTKRIEIYYDSGGTKKRYVVKNPDMSDPELQSNPNQDALYVSWCEQPGFPTNGPDDTSPITYKGKQALFEGKLFQHEHPFGEAHTNALLEGLPPVHRRWPEILDESVWSVYTYEDQETQSVKTNKDVDVYF